MMFKEHIKIIACPDCGGNIREIMFKDQILGFFCERCKIIFPIKEDIPILLPKSARNYKLEFNLIQDISKKVLNRSSEELQQYIGNTLKLLESTKNAKSYEWEDEEFWSKEYKKEANAAIPKNWNNRIWQREFLVECLVNETELNSITILDVGCGEGQNFRLLLSKYCDQNVLYIATDVLLEGLKLNRLRNVHNNSLYILSSANKLPFHMKKIDILCYFGILHHTERKASTVPQDSKLVKKGGYILIHEALERPFFSSFLPRFLKPKAEESAHEERIKKKELLAQINKSKDIEIIALKQMHTVFFGVMRQLFRNYMMNNKKCFEIILTLDIFLMKLFGSFIRFFEPGEIMLLMKKFE